MGYDSFLRGSQGTKESFNPIWSKSVQWLMRTNMSADGWNECIFICISAKMEKQIKFEYIENKINRILMRYNNISKIRINNKIKNSNTRQTNKFQQ